MKLKTRVGNVSLEIPKLVGIDHQAPKRTRSSPNSQGLENMQEDEKRATRASRSRKPCVNRSSGLKVIAIGSWCERRKNWLEPILQPALAQLSLILIEKRDEEWDDHLEPLGSYPSSLVLAQAGRHPALCSENRTGPAGSTGKTGNRSFVRSGSHAKIGWHQTGQKP
ncbi:hypothetical protein PIB30_073677 [Stylosanthes scabra]|uniref:Uncharacterized protein n=1 Tax=Stylosanthes scabra TaxID=79078 RepID=A0ABU6RPS4_9FABA|nr:hypothetical protein [Stylosanthes scabra]